MNDTKDLFLTARTAHSFALPFLFLPLKMTKKLFQLLVIIVAFVEITVAVGLISMVFFFAFTVVIFVT